MNEKRKIDIDPDLYGIGWVTDREPNQDDIKVSGYEFLCKSDNSYWVLALARWEVYAFAWRNAATIEAAKKEQKTVRLAENQEVIAWRYDEPTLQQKRHPGFIAQNESGVVYFGVNIFRWTILPAPQPKKMTVEEFCNKREL